MITDIGGIFLDASKKVIILDNLKSKRISQAIFILNDGETDEFSAVREAERLVTDYLAGKPLCVSKKSKPLKFLLLFLGCTLFSLILFLFFRI